LGKLRFDESDRASVAIAEELEKGCALRIHFHSQHCPAEAGRQKNPHGFALFSPLPRAMGTLKRLSSRMHTGTLRILALAAGAALTLGACTSSTEPGPFSTGGGAAAASDLHNAARANTGERYATGASTQTMANATTFIIAKHQATQRQREVAIARARAAQQKLVQRKGTATAAAPKKKLPRYIAVETVREKTTSPKAKKAVMIWDTQAQQIVGNNVYDIATPPPVGATSRFETYAAEYVGAGL
jgi:hypothetical protein